VVGQDLRMDATGDLAQLVDGLVEVLSELAEHPW
jgi:hypothetical protein